jgi:hypothetical protein
LKEIIRGGINFLLMTEYFAEENPSELEEECQKTSITEDKIDASHELGESEKNGTGSVELFTILSDDDLIFIEKGEEVLGLKGEEAEKFIILCSAFSNGELNDEGREGDLREWAIHRVRFKKLNQNRGTKEGATS